MKKNIKLTVVILLFLFCVPGYTQDRLRIVSLAPSLTKMLYLLDAQADLTGCTSYCDIAKSDNKNIVASAVDVNIEKVFLLKPDIVIATDITKQSSIEALQRLGLKVKIFPKPGSFADLCSQFFEIAVLTDRQTLAQAIISKQKKRLNDLKRLIPEGKTPKIFFEIGTKPLFTVMSDTFMDDYIKHAGGCNIASDLKSGTISRESVLLRNPDVIIIVTMGIAGSEEIKIWSSYKTLNAAMNKRIFIIDSDRACSPTPADFADVVEEMIKKIY